MTRSRPIAKNATNQTAHKHRHQQPERSYSAVLEAAFLVLEYCPFGDMFGVASVLLRYKHAIEIKLNIFKHLIRTLDFMHSTCGLAHRDLKYENVFLNSNLIPVLGDFGFT
jgi:serine/threonine protein kinase